MTWTEKLRAAIRDSGKSTYAIAKESGVPQPTVQNIVNDGADPKLSTAEKIAVVVGVSLRSRPSRLVKK